MHISKSIKDVHKSLEEVVRKVIVANNWKLFGSSELSTASSKEVTDRLEQIELKSRYFRWFSIQLLRTQVS